MDRTGTMETTTKVCGKCKVEKPYDDFHNNKSSKDGKQYSCKNCHNQVIKKHRQENPDKKREQNKKWRQENADKKREYRKKYEKNRRKSDPIYRMVHYLRKRVGSYCRDIDANRTTKTKEMLGVDLDCFKSYMESKFQDGMTWDNYGQWHVDHIKPLSLAITEQEVVELNHYTNLQPLWAIENLNQSNKYEKSH